MSVDATLEVSTAINRGEILIIAEADDAASENEAESKSESNTDEENNEDPTNSTRNDIIHSDDDKEGVTQYLSFQQTLPDLKVNEMEELESDGEFEDTK